MIVAKRINNNGVSFVVVKNVKTKFEDVISKMTYSELINLSNVVSKKEKSLINLELYHRHLRKNSL